MTRRMSASNMQSPCGMFFIAASSRLCSAMASSASCAQRRAIEDPVGGFSVAGFQIRDYKSALGQIARPLRLECRDTFTFFGSAYAADKGRQYGADFVEDDRRGIRHPLSILEPDGIDLS